ncbi:hypothetical protein HPT27_00350 [Permianibacter sp. IMCC34836]|uniref:hypothetical protein n=1 Tax=Permianibacter fluminis TaxID=2738515 RepID=UPI001554BB0E|nr:hypothetical protein [Permianibacter fluminis]NQD35451.1 hypothetical protein [Permianibacter fluminis]
MKKTLLAFVLALPLTVGATSYVPIENIEHHRFVGPSGVVMTAADVRAAIIRGAATHDWVMRDVAPGRIEAVLTEPTGDWKITLEFTYTDTDYSIIYKSSENLLNNKGFIHSSFIRWGRNLMKAIDAQSKAMEVERQAIPAG